MECCTPAPANGSENSPSRTESTISVPTTAYLDATPTSPYTLQGWRYNPIYLKPEDEDQVISSIKPWKGSYVRGSPRVDWAVKVHPEGKRYFVRSEKQGQHVITHSNLYDNDCWETFIQIYDHVLQKFSEQEDLRAVDIVIDRNTFDDDQTPSWGYYAVDWDERIVLWPEEVNPQILIEDNGARNPYGSDHLRLASETQFWAHVEMFPCHRKPPHSYFAELKRILQSSILDSLTSITSTAPYGSAMLERYLEIVKSLDLDLEKHESPEAVFILGRLMYNICLNRYIYMHGQHQAGLDRTKPISTIEEKKSTLFGLFSMMLFDAPHVYLNELENIYVDNCVACVAWDRLIGRMQEDWSNSLTPITVLLGANIGFLAMDKVTAFASIASGVSTAFCLASILICRILMRNFPCITGTNVIPVHQCLTCASSSRLGLRGLAFAFSLPIGLFIWSLICFVVGLLYQLFSVHSIATYVILGISFTLVLTLIIFVLKLDHPTTQSYPSLREELWTRAQEFAGRRWNNIAEKFRRQNPHNVYDASDQSSIDGVSSWKRPMHRYLSKFRRSESLTSVLPVHNSGHAFLSAAEKRDSIALTRSSSTHSSWSERNGAIQTIPGFPPRALIKPPFEDCPRSTSEVVGYLVAAPLLRDPEIAERCPKAADPRVT